MEAICFSETSVHARYTQHHILETTFFAIKIDLRETGWDGMDWIDLAQDRDKWRALVITVMNLRVP
jgi:hypothetical protein